MNQLDREIADARRKAAETYRTLRATNRPLARLVFRRSQAAKKTLIKRMSDHLFTGNAKLF